MTKTRRKEINNEGWVMVNLFILQTTAGRPTWIHIENETTFNENWEMTLLVTWKLVWDHCHSYSLLYKENEPSKGMKKNWLNSFHIHQSPDWVWVPVWVESLQYLRVFMTYIYIYIYKIGWSHSFMKLDSTVHTTASSVSSCWPFCRISLLFDIDYCLNKNSTVTNSHVTTINLCK